MHTATIRLGLSENLGQFSLLVLVNAFVGAMVGLERSILPGVPLPWVFIGFGATSAMQLVRSWPALPQICLG